MYLSRDAILAAQDLPTVDVDCPEWGGTVRIRTLTGAERDAFEASMLDGSGKAQKVTIRNIRARLVSLTAVDEAGNRIFSDADAQALGRKSSIALNRVFEAARKLSGITDEDVDELGKASETDQLDASASDSQDTSAALSANS